MKNWKRYHALRRKGHSKRSAARITNSKSGKRRRRRKRLRLDTNVVILIAAVLVGVAAVIFIAQSL